MALKKSKIIGLSWCVKVRGKNRTKYFVPFVPQSISILNPSSLRAEGWDVVGVDVVDFGRSALSLNRFGPNWGDDISEISRILAQEGGVDGESLE